MPSFFPAKPKSNNLRPKFLIFFPHSLPVPTSRRTMAFKFCIPIRQSKKHKSHSFLLLLKMGRPRLLVSDFVLSFMWVWSEAVVKIFVYKCLGFSHEAFGEILKSAFSIMNAILFAFLGKISNGGDYNPLNVLAYSIFGDFRNFLYCVGARIPAQVLGSIMGVRLLLVTLLEVGHGPCLKTDIHQGELTEGILTFAVVIISLGLSTKVDASFFIKTWIFSVSKFTLHILGSDLTGGCMNPAYVTGWAYARAGHITKDYILVYWLAPAEATLLAVWTFRLIVWPVKGEKTSKKSTFH